MKSHMIKEIKLRKYTAISIIIYVMLMLAASLSLIFFFNFPDILREPVEVMLESFNNNRDLIVPAYYLFVLSGIVFTFMSILIYKTITTKDSTLGLFALVCGIMFGLLSNIGFIRWPFLMDYLSITFNDPNSTMAQKDSIKLIFNAFHNYAGVAVGENFAFWFEGFWMIFISILIKRKADLFPKYIGWIGILLGSGMLIYTLEQFGGIFAFLSTINVIIHAGLLVWLLAVSILLIKSGTQKQKLGVIAGSILIIFYLILLIMAF